MIVGGFKLVQAATMTCPHCRHEVSLSWSKYLSSRFGRHACPSCHKRFKIIVTAASVGVLLLATIIAAGMPAVIVFFFLHNFWYTVVAYVLLLLGVVLPFDRWLDNNVRPVKPIH